MTMASSSTTSTRTATTGGDTAKVPNDYAQSIIDSLDQKYPDHSSTSTAVGPVIPGDYDTFMITTEADSNS